MVELILINLNLDRLEHVSEVLASDKTSAMLVHYLEEVCHVLDTTFFDSFDELVDDAFLSRVDFKAEALKLVRELFDVDHTVFVDVERFPETFELLLA